ncbi:hypothetical protein NEOKW01_2042 [Nematocida sp. AWRm80]|nr:hypothetical protein NEOKW01_2042 [Nematocida sp. AWRm80]
MEYLLCSTLEKREELLKYITMNEYTHRIEEVNEIIYSYIRCTLILSEEKILYKSDLNTDGSNSTDTKNTFLKLIYPPDKNKTRTVLSRNVFTSKVYSSNGLKEILSSLGYKILRERKYTRNIYQYNGIELITVTKQNRTLLLARTTESNGESLLNEVKSKLLPWVSLMVPPEQSIQYLF